MSLRLIMKKEAEMTTIGWLVLSWMICGVLAYGLYKNYWKQFHQKTLCVGYNALATEAMCFWSWVLGPIGLVGAVLWILTDGYEFGFCFKMPKELCKPRRPE